ncbi:hypothetical protein pCXcHC2016_04 [Xenohaliotis phage pCXc-HC2016]|nr:hypothetical protein pCXcHC2016_04 [Xenohaliotis phage pCXc-HC2016]AQW89111.1 hypothetical protein pCXcHR2015_04 [Xenohaliotis phage pCXc-HR2015]
MTVPKFTAPEQVLTADEQAIEDVSFNPLLNPDTSNSAPGDLVTLFGLSKKLEKGVELDSLSAPGILSGLTATPGTGLSVDIATGSIWSRNAGTKTINATTVTITPAAQDSESMSTIVANESTGVISAKSFSEPAVDEILICDVKAEGSNIQAIYTMRSTQLKDSISRVEPLIETVGLWYNGVSFKKNRTDGFATDGGKLYYGAKELINIPATGVLPIVIYNHKGLQEVKTTFDQNFLQQAWLTTEQAPKSIVGDDQVFWYVYLLENGTFAMLYPQAIGSNKDIDNRILDLNILSLEQANLLPNGADKFSTIIGVLVVSNSDRDFSDSALFQLGRGLSRGGGVVAAPSAPIVTPMPTPANAGYDVVVDNTKNLNTEDSGFENIPANPGIVSYFPGAGYVSFRNQPKNTNIYTIVCKFRDKTSNTVEIVDSGTNIPNVSGTFQVLPADGFQASYKNFKRATLINNSKSFFDAIAANLPDFTSFKDQLDPEKARYMIFMCFSDHTGYKSFTVPLTQSSSISDINILEERLKKIPNEFKSGYAYNTYPMFKYPLYGVFEDSAGVDTLLFRIRDDTAISYNDTYTQGDRDFYRIHALSDEDLGKYASSTNAGDAKARSLSYFPAYAGNLTYDGTIFHINFIKLN